MKIGIITIHNSPNYGASLQSYALYRFLQSCGYDVEIIDLHRPYQEDYVPSKMYLPYREKEKSPYTKFKEFIKKTIGIGRKTRKISYLSAESKLKFDEFNSNLVYTRPYYSIDDLYKNPPLCDVYLTGSDQVWNPDQPYCVEPYFLTFAPKGKKRLSYAASLGVYSISDKYVPEYCKWLRMYDAISVRESQTAEYLGQLAEVNIQTVADPTFLLENKQWNDIAVKPKFTESYILIFTLAPNKDLLNYAIRLSVESGLKLVNFRSLQPEYYDGAPYTPVTDAGPREFLGYLGNADIVITDSFHGSVISLLMGTKNVFTYIAPTNQRGVRIEELYTIVGYEDHIMHGDLSKNYKDLCSMSIDHDKVEERINLSRIKSREFLTSNLKNG